MTIFLQVGLVLGAVIGLCHGATLFRARRLVVGSTQAFWFALWAFALWTLLGAYVLFFWLLGAAVMALGALWRPSEAER